MTAAGNRKAKKRKKPRKKESSVSTRVAKVPKTKAKDPHHCENREKA